MHSSATSARGRSGITPFRHALAALLILVAAHANAFGFEDVARRAAALAAQPYKVPTYELPRALRELTYDQYRDIRFKPARSIWREANLPFELQLFHVGLLYTQPVRISEVVAGVPREIRFDTELFTYGANKFDPHTLGPSTGFSGFRVHAAVNRPAYKDEVLAFQGASYFRSVGRGQRYGLSARGIAVDTALASGEQFPQFVEFWIERPGASARELTIYALLDSPSMSGAYRFVLRPGSDVQTTVKARLFMRENVAKLGLAPLTSMFLSGENQRSPQRDYRPEVHDSDILLIHSGTGEWITRPLVNPKRLLVTSFALTNPLGFGLMQRDRTFANYQDLEARYELRPSAWVEPGGAWGKGRVELVQIPTPDETNDNIVAYWVPEALPAIGKPFDLDYRIQWQLTRETRPPLSYIAQTRRGHGYTKQPDSSIGFVVDFEGPVFAKLVPDAVVESVVTVVTNGELVESRVARNEVTAGYRLRLRVKPVDAKKEIELRAFLRHGDTTLTPTWSYIVPPE